MARPAAMTAQQLRDVRNKYDLSTMDLMVAMSLSRSMVYYLLAGRRRITAQHAESMQRLIQSRQLPANQRPWYWG